MDRAINSCAIVAVGAEVLCGDVINTNAAYAAGRLERLGAPCIRQSVIPDDEETVTREIRSLLGKCGLIVTIGGLGPTKDDLTKKAVASAVGREMVYDPSVMASIERFFGERGLRPSENNDAQCWTIEGARIIPNDNGTAPGELIDTGDTLIAMFPGPPDELIPMFEGHFEEMLKDRFSAPPFKKAYTVFGRPEAAIENSIRKAGFLKDGEELNSYIDDGAVRLVLTLPEKNAEAESRVTQSLLSLFGDDLSEGRLGDIVEETGRILIRKGLSISTAESLTGGLLAGELTKISGISAVLRGGAVTYVNEVKQGLLGVSPETLERFGAVSAECACEMARGAAERFGTDVALSTTGVAGPSESEGKKVGTVFIGIYFKGEVCAFAHNYIGTREKIRRKTVMSAVSLLRRYLERD